MPGADSDLDPDRNDLPVIDLNGPACRHLRHKGMYVYTDEDGGQSHADYDNTIYWCLKTMKGFGPDDDLVGGEDCRNSSRSCYDPS
jgi:hypothetical protein